MLVNFKYLRNIPVLPVSCTLEEIDRLITEISYLFHRKNQWFPWKKKWSKYLNVSVKITEHKNNQIFPLLNINNQWFYQLCVYSVMAGLLLPLWSRLRGRYASRSRDLGIHFRLWWTQDVPPLMTPVKEKFCEENLSASWSTYTTRLLDDLLKVAATCVHLESARLLLVNLWMLLPEPDPDPGLDPGSSDVDPCWLTDDILKYWFPCISTGTSENWSDWEFDMLMLRNGMAELATLLAAGSGRTNMDNVKEPSKGNDDLRK